MSTPTLIWLVILTAFVAVGCASAYWAYWHIIDLRDRVKELESVERPVEIHMADDSPRQMMRDLNELRRRVSRHTGAGR